MSIRHAIFLVFWIGGMIVVPLGIAVFVNWTFLMIFAITGFIWMCIEGNAIVEHNYHITPLCRMHLLNNDLHKATRVEQRLKQCINDMKTLAAEMSRNDQPYEAQLLRMKADTLEIDLDMAREDIRLKEMEIRSRKMLKLTRGD